MIWIILSVLFTGFTAFAFYKEKHYDWDTMYFLPVISTLISAFLICISVGYLTD